MCLGIPGRITGIIEDGLLPQGEVDFGGTSREVCLAYTPEAGIGDWVLVHVGFAISQLSEEEAQRTLADLRELAEAGEAHELGGGPGDAADPARRDPGATS
ncbi:HypC/HybG/HupF family hydrogenase formation chaperone [bacterium]|nr:HypC/HybG/HupF family hydrogenase formation chaperone [bacterium]